MYIKIKIISKYYTICDGLSSRTSLYIMDTVGPDIFDHLLLQYIDFSLLEVKNVLGAPVGTKTFVLIVWKFFYYVLNLEVLLREVPLY